MNDLTKLGPLKNLIGRWEGNTGEDTAPSPSRGIEVNKFREIIDFELINEVDNHEQFINGVRYKMTAWEDGDEEPFHEEVGYYLWDADRKEIIKSFIIPRGVSVLAGGVSEGNASSIYLEANRGSNTYGICSNLFLEKEFKTMKYTLNLDFINEHTFKYEQITQLKIKNQEELFLHKDTNILKKVL